MEDKELAQKYILILNEIIQKETLYPNPKNKERDYHSAMGWEADSCDFNLTGKQFINFFRNLEEKGVLEIKSKTFIPESLEKNTPILKEVGQRLFKNESVVFYWKVDLKKAKTYRQELKEIIDIGENNSLADYSKIKTKLIYLGAGGICLESDKRCCYSPKDYTNRFKYLKRIIKKKGKPISAKELGEGDLGKGLKVNRRFVIARAITDINKLAKQELGLKQELIWGGDGYRLNTEDYEIISS